MGSISALSSLERVRDAHSKELAEEVKLKLPPNIASKVKEIRFVISDTCYELIPVAVFPDGELDLFPYDIDVLGDRFPDCEVGY